MRYPAALRQVVAALVLVTSSVGLSTAMAQTFTFGGGSWDQGDTPDVALPIAPATVSGAIVTAMPGDTTAAIAGFPAPTTGFDDSLTIGRELGLSGSGTRAVNLPVNNDGTAARSGFQLSWTLGRTLQNQSGADFVVYESGSPGIPEAYMVQVRNDSTLVWSPWYYAPASVFQLYTGSVTEGAFATSFDLDDFGIGAFDRIDAIRIVNMTSKDRMEGPGTEKSPGIFVAQGFVIPEDNDATSTIAPDPGTLATFPLYGAATFDPDVLYVGMLNAPNACGDGVTRGGEACDDGNTNDYDGCSSTCQLENRQSAAQRSCLMAVNNSASRVADTQLRAGLRCLTAATLDASTGAQTCLTTDEDGRIAGSRAQTANAIGRACRTTPNFGQTSPTVTNDAAQDEMIGLIGDVFGVDLDAAAILAATDEAAATCQTTVLKQINSLARVKRRFFLRCKRTGLIDSSIISTAGIEGCLDQMLVDPKAKIQKARQTLDHILASTCLGVDLTTALPGQCASASDRATCIDTAASCRICRLYYAADNLTLDCDAFDDGVRNGTCPM